jgi:hypothetical protein
MTPHSAYPWAVRAPSSQGVRWFSRRAILFHLALLIWFPGCLLAMWWQVTVALAGNALGWLYAIEWPVFALAGVIGWWQVLHDDEQTVGRRRAARSAPAPTSPGVGEEATLEAQEQAPAFDPQAMEAIHRAEEHDEELAAYNAYLASLATTGSRKTWRNPTGAS